MDPEDSEHGEQRLARLDKPTTWGPSLTFLKFAIGALLFAPSCFLVLLMFSGAGQAPRIIGNAAVLILALVAWWLLSRGLVKVATYLLAYGSWMFITGLAIFNGGVHAPAVMAYPLIILLTGWMISSRAAQCLAALSVAASLGLLAADMTGSLPLPPPTSAAMHSIVQITIFVVSGALITVLARTYADQLEKLDKAANALSDRTVALEASKAELHRAQIVANVGSWVYDVAQDRMRLSHETCRIFGVPQGATGNRDDYLARVHPDDRSAVASAWQLATQGSSLDSEHRIVVGDGVRWVRQKAEMEFSGNGTLLRAIGISQDITDRKIAEEKIKQLAYFDSLTQLPNRTLLQDRVQQLMKRSARSGHWGAVLFIDLDHFKTINDTKGHAKGDLVLRQVAQRLSNCIREDDTVARLGGDEFVVMLANLSRQAQDAAAETEVLARKILAALRPAYQFVDFDYCCTASIGAALFLGHDLSVADVLMQADLAMYRAKAMGRDSLCFFDPVMQTMASEQASLASDLRRSLSANEFLLYFQAQVVNEGRITGAEVLVRWQHPARGLVMPAQFIPVAEDTGLIFPLGHWILETACHQLAVWAARPETANLTIAVNVSARQFRQDDFVAQVRSVLARTGANPCRLKLELTESLLVDDIGGVIAKMMALREQGISLSLDDFGTGFSSLSSLKRLPLDQIKIDQSFVRDILDDADDAAIAKTVITLAASMGLSVMAEGVETRAQRDLLASLGCDAYQGYLFSQPLPLAEFEAFLNRA